MRLGLLLRLQKDPNVYYPNSDNFSIFDYVRWIFYIIYILPEYFDAFLLICVSAKLEVDNVDEVDVDMWLGWFDGWVGAPCMWGDDTGDGEEDKDKLLERDIAEPWSEWEIWFDDDVPVEDDTANDDPGWAWLEGGGTAGWLAAFKSWLEYSWSTAECIGKTASISHSILV